MIRLAPLLLLLAACAETAAPPPPPAPRPAAAAAQGNDSALRNACEAEAERAVAFRERGQDSRLDRDIGATDATNTIPSLRVQSDAYGRRVLREELIRDCIRANTAGPRPQDRAQPAAAQRGRRN
ncbi:hypothetical protein J5Y09_03420 [Roseomonas sp. PWR1]|uniref:Lipoprotein n=1 Tax=Roseomonas nitratireducens TaxID=2820810 RepID=A0ABS4ANK9_9PROT|nr:hypothetical protein [Neoroseomonas nitratireducens]MBP0462949.1 hypothetical protein [Neoroseomonas nitratireducens]